MADNSLMSGILTANQSIGNINPMGNFIGGMEKGLDIQKKQMENAKTNYEQDLTVKLQKAIHDSVDPTSGNIDPDKFKVVAHQYGVDPQAIDYALNNVVKIWESAKKVAQAKQAVDSVSETGAKEVESANKPAGTSWTTAPRGSAAAPAPKTSPEPEAKPQSEDPFLPGYVAPVDSGIRVGSASVEGQGQKATDYHITTDPMALEATEVKPPHVPGVIEAISGITPDAGVSISPVAAPVNPLKVADMDQATKNALSSQLRQQGLLGQWTKGKRGDYDKLAQDVLDSKFAQYQATVGQAPTKQMFTDKEGAVDIGAYNRAINEYNQKVATATKSFQDDIGKAFGDQFTQEMTRQSNRRAEIASKQGQTTFGQTQERIAAIQGTDFEGGKLSKGITADNVADVEKNITSYNRIKGAVHTIDSLLADPNLDKLNADQLAAKLKNFNTTMGQVEGLSTESQRETLEEGLRKDPNGQSLIRKYFKDAELSVHGLLDALKKANIEKWTAQDRRTFLTLLGDPARDAMAHGAAATALRVHLNVPETPAPAPTAPAPKEPWSKKKAGGAKAPAPKKESPLERLRRLRGTK